MPSIVLAPKTIPPHAAFDPVFTPAFYAPYESAASAALAMLCAARAQLAARDAVHQITYRLKTPASIRGKLFKRGLPATAASAAALHDIAGLRAVFADVSQVYAFARLLMRSPAAEFAYARDYIATPKPSGYQSLHLILRIPAQPGSRCAPVPVEIQLRTAAMDAWASVEHDACYKPASLMDS